MIISQDGFDFSFDSNKCLSCDGNCCIGKSGYIWLSRDEVEEISNFLKIDKEDFFKKWTKKVGYKRSLLEIKLSKDNYACIFFDTKQKKCNIYSVRPKQCRTFPFWEHFKKNTKEVKEECPAII